MADAALLKEMNLKKIRTAMLTGQPFSKTELAETTGLSFPTVGKMVDELVGTQELQILGMQNSSGGRCSRIYQYNPDYRNALGLILEGQTIDWFILDCLGMTKNQGQIQCEGDLLQTLITLLLQARNNEPALSCFTLGIAANSDGETVQESYEYPQLRGVNLLKTLEQASGLKGTMGNDMWFSAEGSWQRCRLDERTTLISFYIGNCGFGSSFVYHGQALKGAHHVAGEIELLPWIHKEALNAEQQPDSMPDSILQCIMTYAIITDPDFIQLYSHPFFVKHYDEIKAALAQCFREVQPPTLLLTDNFRIDYEIGLSRQALRLMSRLEA